MVKRTGILLLIAVLGALCIGPVGRLLPVAMNSLVVTVEATVGRPLTPVSVAGVARRTSRRCEGESC